MRARNEAAAPLAPALDPATIPRALAHAVGLAPDQVATLAWSAKVLKHRVAKRWLIRYTLLPRGTPPGRSRKLFGKLYVQSSEAARIYGLTRALRTAVYADGAALRIPAPLLLMPEIGLVLQEYVPGGDLGTTLICGDAARPLTLAAQWLARLHAATPLRELPVKSLDYEMAKVDAWCDEIARHLTART